VFRGSHDLSPDPVIDDRDMLEDLPLTRLIVDREVMSSLVLGDSLCELHTLIEELEEFGVDVGDLCTERGEFHGI
jgi:hypothetical protein